MLNTSPSVALCIAVLAVIGCGSEASGPSADADSGLGDPGAQRPEGLAEVVTPGFIDDPTWRKTSDVLTELPEAVHLKTDTQSYNRQYYFAVLDGALWIKPNVERTGEDGPWERVPLTDDMDGRVTMVSVDDHGLVIFDDERDLQWSMNEALGVPMEPLWTRSWGAPLATGPGMTLPEPIVKWEWAVLTPGVDGYFLDPAGNEQPVGLGTVAHVWLLAPDGKRITYMDPILPVDTSYEMCSPHRGRFQAVNLSTSGSTVFVVNRYGDMYTRLYDFDISGADTLFFTYTYEDTDGMAGAPIKLPAPGWVQHPKVDGEITDRITIHKVDRGSDSRVLRIEGRDADGEVGYYEKSITDADSGDWVFHPTGDPLRGNPLDNDPDDRSTDSLGDGQDRSYALSGQGLELSLADFNLFCSPAQLTVRFDSGEELSLVLHHADAIRQQPRGDGLMDAPRELNGTIEVPEALWARRDALPQDAADFLAEHLSADSRFTELPLSASLERVELGPWQLRHEER